MSKRAGLVFTTISDPVLLEDYFANFDSHSRLDEVTVYVIPDRKTPAEAGARCEEFRSKGLDVQFPSLDEQEDFLDSIGFPPAYVPYNSDNRRNVGYLMAMRDGVDFIVSIDDDNYCREEEDFIGSHAIVCEDPAEHPVVHSDSGWYNVCERLSLEPEREVYARGFPYHVRARSNGAAKEVAEKATVRINAGLWFDAPDLDGITWLVSPVESVALRGGPVVLGAETWSPVNTQNTALHREVGPSYYFVPMGYPIAGMSIDRHGDIFSGYFSQAVARHMGHAVRFGDPIAIHRRNSHNYLRDATAEMGCVWILEDLLPWLTEQKLSGSTYGESYACLSHLLEEQVGRFKGFVWDAATEGYFHLCARRMRAWVEACREIGVP